VTTTEEHPVERRKGSHEAIAKLIAHRTDMLTLYGELASHRPYHPTDELLDLLQRFCQALVDYTADAHFRLYRFIETRNERRQSVARIAQTVYPKISVSTQRILDFNDKYDTTEHCKESLKQLEHDLSVLGEHLADRIELEDRLVAALRSSRR